VIAFGYGTLRLHPDALWAMTPREVAAAVRARSGRAAAAPISRARLDELMRAHPDEEA
jgi:uncharacterized phage protein (TIGR02216 family)